HTFIVLSLSSSAAVTRRLLSGLKTRFDKAPVRPLRVRNSWPVWASHIFTVLSRDELARRFPSGLNATWVTLSVCALRERSSSPVCAPPTSPPPPPPLPGRFPSALNPPWCPSPPLKRRSTSPVCASHTFTSPKPSPVRRLPSGLKETMRVAPLRV